MNSRNVQIRNLLFQNLRVAGDIREFDINIGYFKLAVEQDNSCILQALRL